ncbi:dienelactone hydrolase family protein [Roseivirga pacifica]|uniref:Dienelactone hydrolase family protein n=1 Tax=Roseivirga pacifica TaxID=1267423 RepID=A0A1I0PXY7_9BACT|nr:prolyl oligopeptidase family serine peptidase [Roseivirga pacifica]RKQ43427.1 dienelactone hydrolase family protein [Roseivirga pacifica]SEW19473.1 Dienelactone hydrolase family protein [Roseivirga pacifica]
MNKLTAILALSLVAFGLKAQDKSAFEHRTHDFKKGTLNYRVLYPENFDEGKEYPLVLFLHGAGERGSDNNKQLAHGSKLFLDAQNRKDFPAIIVFPQCPTDDYWANVDRVVDENGTRHFTFKKGGKPTNAMQGVLSLTDSLTKLAHVNTEKVYVMGLSMGGMGTFELVSRKPNTFAAAAPICGGDNPKAANKYAKKVPFWIFHGRKDDIVLPKYSEAMAAAINAKGGDAKLTIYPNANHNSWDPTFAEPELLSWLFSNSK